MQKISIKKTISFRILKTISTKGEILSKRVSISVNFTKSRGMIKSDSFRINFIPISFSSKIVVYNNRAISIAI